MTTFLQHLIYEIKATQSLEWLAAIAAVISVLFAQRNHILLYPFGLISTAIYAYLLAQSKVALYAESGLNVYYFIMTIYGWWHWQKKNQEKVLVSVCSKKDWFIVTSIVVILWLLFHTLLLHTNSKVPIADSFVSATACAGMWLLARRKIENWLLLNVSNFVAIPLFYTKGLFVTMFLTVFLFFVAISGFLHWRKLYGQRVQE